jgi:nucleoside 2-deoxyribosyltransferase
MAFTIYVSDTSPELANVRAVLLQQITEKGMTVTWLTDEERQRADMMDVVRRKIASADAFIALITYLHGWTPSNTGSKSLTEIECDLALEAVKPSAILMPETDSDIDGYLRMWALDQSDAERSSQQAFWKNLQQRGAAITYSDIADFSTKLTTILTSWSTQTSTPPPSTLAASAQAAPPVSGLTRERRDNLFPTDALNIDDLAELVAEKTAEKVQEAQQKRDQELVEQTLKYNEALKLQPGELVFGKPSKSSQFKGDIFMIMPFAEAFTGIYTDVIRPLVKDLGLSITRGDEFSSVNGSIIEEVWSALNNCQFVIAEITGGNDNVFYELGIAHTLNKPAILITQATAPEKVPFDIRHLRYIQYENTASGGAKLRDDLKTNITRLLSDLNEEWGKKTL